MKAGAGIMSGISGIIRLDKRSAAVGCAFFGALVLSVSLFFLFGNSRIRRVFFFPLGVSGKISAEARMVTNHGDIEGDIRELVEGEILGPVNHGMKLLISRNVTLQSLFVRNRVLYLDLSPIAVVEDGLPLRLGEAIGVLKRSISFNFPIIRETVILVDGQVPVFGRTGENSLTNP